MRRRINANGRVAPRRKSFIYANQVFYAAIMRLKNIRYLVAVGIGASVEFVIAFAVSRVLPLPVGAAFGFLFGASVGYVLFEFWVFERASRQLAIGRLLATFGSAGAALCLRVAVIAALSGIVPHTPIGDAFRLAAAMIGSFLVNYLLISRIFQSRALASGGDRPIEDPR